MLLSPPIQYDNLVWSLKYAIKIKRYSLHDRSCKILTRRLRIMVCRFSSADPPRRLNGEFS